MELTNELIDKLCRLSRLAYNDEQRQAIKADLGRMLDFVETISQVDTAGVEPLIHLSEEVNQLRDDVPAPGLPHDVALRTAPKHDGDYFRVPKVIDK